MKANPRKNYYGGSADAANTYRENYADNVDAGSAVVGSGINQLSKTATDAEKQASLGRGILSQGVNTEIGGPFKSSGTGSNILAGINPGEASELAARKAVADQARATQAAASRGGALGIRDAVTAGAFSAPAIAQNIQAQRAADEINFAKARADQAQAEDAINLSGYTNQQGLNAARGNTLLGTGSGLLSGANTLGLNTGNSIAQTGLNQQGQFLDALSDVEGRQLAADMDYDQRRQQEQQRKSNNIWNFAGSLLGAGGQVMGAGFGKGK